MLKSSFGVFGYESAFGNSHQALTRRRRGHRRPGQLDGRAKCNDAISIVGDDVRRLHILYMRRDRKCGTLRKLQRLLGK